MRTRKSGYSRKGKSRNRDTYGQWKDGRRLMPEIIAGHTLTYTPGRD